MSHVREGEIHAYLDGALNRLGETRAGEVRRHVDGCEDCRSRLEEERRLRDVASQLLDSGAPGSFDMPPFEEILRRAEAGPAGSSVAGASDPPSTRESSDRAARRSLGRTQRWAWAASLVLALGTGWLLRGSEIPQARPSDLESPSVATEPQSESVESDETALGFAQVQGAVEGEREVDAVTEVTDLRGAGSQPGRSESSGETVEARQRSVSLQEANVQPRTPVPAVAEALNRVQTREAGARDQVAARISADSIVAPGADRPLQGRAVGDEAFEEERVAREDVAAAAVPVPEEEAAARRNEAVAAALDDAVALDAKIDGLSVALAPGLPVIEMTGDSSSLRVLQLFPEGDTLMLEFTGIEGGLGLLESAETLASGTGDALAARSRGAVLRRMDADAPVSTDEQFVSVVRISQGVGLLVVRSHRPQAELEALLRNWGMLNP